ncbi:P2Y purinoceptor 4-like [Aplochiton taeniatus]
MGNHQAQPPEHSFCGLWEPGEQSMLAVQLYLMPGVFLGVLIMGLPLNLLSLWVFSHRLKRWTRSTVLLFNLTLADTSWVLALPFLIQYHLAQVTWSLGQPLCQAIRIFYHNYFYLSIYFVTCISLDRYLAIVHPLRSMVLLGRRQTYLLCVAVWLATMAMSVPVVTMSETQQCPGDNRTICPLYMMLEDPDQSLPYSLCTTFFGFLLPLVAICYGCLRSVKELKSLPSFARQFNRGRRLARVLSAVLILFAVFYLPYHLIRNATILMRVIYPDSPGLWQRTDFVFSLEMCFCSLNTCVNPIFSCFVGHQLRREIQDTLNGLLPLWFRRKVNLLIGKREARTLDHGVATISPL